jgi:hypothetical protein
MEYAESEDAKVSEEQDDLLSTQSSNTSYGARREGGEDGGEKGNKQWTCKPCRTEGRMIIIGEYSSKTEYYRAIVLVSTSTANLLFLLLYCY